MQILILLVILSIIFLFYFITNTNGHMEGFTSVGSQVFLGDNMGTLKGECINPYVGSNSVEGIVWKTNRNDNTIENTRLTNIPGVQLKLMSDADPYPYNESSPKEVKWIFPRGVRRRNHLNANMIEHRNPGLIKQRYDYVDQKLCYVDAPPVLKDKARLRELPLQLRNWYHARVPKCLAEHDNYYNPSNIIGNKYKCECPLLHKSNSDRTIIPIITDPTPFMSITANNQMTDETPLDIARNGNIISGYNPSDALPAQYADRSKTSVEKIMATQNIKDEYSEPTYRWSPYEY